jgi:hypothetical protein
VLNKRVCNRGLVRIEKQLWDLRVCTLQGIAQLALLPEEASLTAFPGSPAGKLLEGSKGSMRYNSLGAFSSLGSLATYHSLTSRS